MRIVFLAVVALGRGSVLTRGLPSPPGLCLAQLRPAWRAPVTRMSGGGFADGFGLSKRERTRLSRLRRPDEPLEEELRGLALIGAVAGALFLGGPLGLLVGFNVGPWTAMLDGQLGERMRLAGWEADERRAALMGHPTVASFRRRLLAFDARTGVSTRGRALAAAAWARLAAGAARLADWWGASAAKRAVLSAWRKSGMHARYTDFRDRQVLNARMRQARLEEFYRTRGGGDFGGGSDAPQRM
mmetsp:Transcript_775/g.2391  ORF Transcript_775/g.2391 Transcript_775/m.2391 type:complete len:243 (+) Transcript_775:272-1000(+)